MTMSMRQPPSVEPLADTPFDPKKHLQLEAPEHVWSLSDFGYAQEVIDAAQFPLGATSAFRMLSAEGVAALRDSVAQLQDRARNNERIANYVRGSAYASRFIRGLCLSPEVNDFVAQLAGAPVLPHPMALYQGHINLKPEDPGRDVDQWHTDTVALDYVLLITDPKTFEGGHFEYFMCPKGYAIRSLIREEGADKIVKVDLPEAGYALLQQGNLVVHRASAVTKGDERTTFVQSYIPDSPRFIDVSKLADCKPVDPHEILFTEWARYKAFLSQRRLTAMLDNLRYTDDTNYICSELRRAIRDVEEAILEISDPADGRLIHYGHDALTDPTV